MGEMPAGGQIHPHERVAWLQQGQEHRLIRLGAGMGLHIGERAVEQGLGPLDRKPLGDIDELATTIVSAARIPLGILVGQDGALGLKHSPAHDVLRGDELDLGALPLELLPNHTGNVRIGITKAGREEPICRDGVRIKSHGRCLSE